MQRANATSSRRVLAIAWICFAIVPRAQAYIDPGAGSFIFQAAIAALLAGVVVLKHQWQRVQNLFRRSGRNPRDAEADD